MQNVLDIFEQPEKKSIIGKEWTKQESDIVDKICRNFCDGGHKILRPKYNDLLKLITENQELRTMRGEITVHAARHILQKLQYRCFTTTHRTRDRNQRLVERGFEIVFLCNGEIVERIRLTKEPWVLGRINAAKINAAAAGLTVK
jgi:hypothetical protein